MFDNRISFFLYAMTLVFVGIELADCIPPKFCRIFSVDMYVLSSNKLDEILSF